MSLRIGQCEFAAASIGVMVFSRGFTGYTAAFCYLIASMGFQLLWSFGLACLDMHALRGERDLQNLTLLCLSVIGDWVTAKLSLAAACSSARVIVLSARDLENCTVQSRQLPCATFQIAVVLSFLTWILTAISSHVMFWILASIPTALAHAFAVFFTAEFLLYMSTFDLRDQISEIRNFSGVALEMLDFELLHQSEINNPWLCWQSHSIYVDLWGSCWKIKGKD